MVLQLGKSAACFIEPVRTAGCTGQWLISGLLSDMAESICTVQGVDKPDVRW